MLIRWKLGATAVVGNRSAQDVTEAFVRDETVRHIPSVVGNEWLAVDLGQGISILNT